MDFSKRVKDGLFVYLLKGLDKIPATRWFDKLFSLTLFVVAHRRWPTRKLIFNDVVYRIKTTDEILDPLRIFVSDKEYLKLYVSAVIGDRYNVPTIDIVRNVEEIPSYEFPAACCIKPTHACNRVIIRKNNEPVDRARIQRWFATNYYRTGREANYKLLKPKVIVEPIIFNDPNAPDYKFFCYRGAPKLVQVDADRYIKHKRKLFDSRWNEMDFSIFYPKSEEPIAKPDNFSEMLDIAARLSAPFSFVRIDLYSDGKTCLVGEITNCPGNAQQAFVPPSGEITASQIIFGRAD